MDIFLSIIQNKEILKIVYALAIILICMIIVLKTHKLFHLSSHQGIRYFRNAFFFYGLGFFTRYILGSEYFWRNSGRLYFMIIIFLFQFFLIMGGFFLAYSLLWKRMDGQQHYTSLFHFKLIIFYLIALILVSLDMLWETYIFMFISQIIIFLIATIVSYKNYRSKHEKGKFLKFYFIAMLLTFLAWILNTLVSSYFEWNQNILISTYILNIIVFFLFLYGIIKITK